MTSPFPSQLLSDGSQQWFIHATTGQPYCPTCYTLTTRDGVQYTIDARNGDLLSPTRQRLSIVSNLLVPANNRAFVATDCHR